MGKHPATIRETLTFATDTLSISETPFLDAAVLLGHALNISKESLFASFSDTVPASKTAAFQEMLSKRASGIPIAYIIREKEFFGITFYVDERVLIPRAETEILVETALQCLENSTWGFAVEAAAEKNFAKKKSIKVLDLCTGSGCVGLTILKKQPEIQLTCADIDSKALEVCSLNAEQLFEEAEKNHITLIKSDICSRMSEKYHLITANPPYVSPAEMTELPKSVTFEPALALHGGRAGTEMAYRVISEGFDHLYKNGYLIMEGGMHQMELLAGFMEAQGFKEINIIKDLARRKRVVAGQK